MPDRPNHPRPRLPRPGLAVLGFLLAGCSLVPNFGGARVDTLGRPKHWRLTTTTTDPTTSTTGSTTLSTTSTTAAPTTTTAAPSTTTTAAPTTSTTAKPTTTSYLFDDEFNGSSLDLSKWQPNWLGASNSSITKPINSAELSCYDPAQVSEPGDGYLHLRAEQRSCTATNGTTYSYASGMVESLPHFTFTYGHLEARIYFPSSGSSTANWPAFWADGTGTWPTTGENDVVEGLNGHDCYHFHSTLGGPGGCATLSSNGGWHVFAADWRPGIVNYYYDGNLVGTLTSGITSSPMYLILNLGVGGYGGPIATPSDMLVDYVRVSA